MSRNIPVPVMAVVSDVIGSRYTHAQIDNLMETAGIELGTPPGGNRQVKTRGWLRYANEMSPDPLSTLGKVLIELMEVPSSSISQDAEFYEPQRERVRKALSNYGLSYVRGGYITKIGARQSAELSKTSLRRVICPACKQNLTASTKTRNLTQLRL